MKNLNLAEVTKIFLNIDMDKSERVGNWLQRPLRDEQKKYAALDAYCVGGKEYYYGHRDRLKWLNWRAVAH